MTRDESQHLVVELCAQELSTWVQPPKDARETRILGWLRLAHADVETEQRAVCSVEVPAQWWENHPIVKCHESWLNRSVDWHAYSDQSLCWVLPMQWRDVCEEVILEMGLAKAARYCTGWMFNNVRWLLYRHYMAPQLGITKWPETWPGWKHGYDGVAQYLEKRARRRRSIK